MNPFGGTPICPRCNKAVYAAEQAVGPARKMYHKSCLTCTSCNTRLDPGALQEHDTEPYCKNCHRRLFSTQDLRHANLPTMPSSPKKSDEFDIASTTTYTHTTTYNIPSAPSSPDRAAITRNAAPSTPVRTFQPPMTASISTPTTPARTYTSARFTSPSPRFTQTPDSQSRPISPTFTGGGTPKAFNLGGRVECPKCHKAVYFAEQVIAMSKKWHKACLQCASCNKRLDSNAVNDRDGEPYCRACYSKNHGPAGSGYALLGKAGG